MNQLTFWLGFFAGSTSLTVVLLVWLRGFKSEDREKLIQQNTAYQERSLAALQERNAIDRDMANSLRVIARQDPPAPSVASEKEGKLPFDFLKALAGFKVITRDGQEVTEITHDGGDMIDGMLNGVLCSWWKNGRRDYSNECSFDLFLAPTP